MQVRHDDNVFRSRDEKVTDTILSFRPSMRAVSQWSNHELVLEAGAAKDVYYTYTDENRRDWSASLGGRLDVLRGTDLRATLSVSDLQEEPDDPGSATAGAPGDHKTWGGRLEASHHLGRLGFSAGAKYTGLSYDEAANKGLDRGELEVGVRAGYRILSEYEAFVRATVHRRGYERLTGGFDRDSDGWELVAGAELDLGGLVVGEVFGGWRRQDYRDRLLPSISEPTLGISVDWNVTPLTTVGADVQRSVNEIDARASGVLATSAGIDVTHELRRNLVLNAGVGLSRQRHRVVAGERGYSSDLVGVDVGGTWLLDRNARLELGYRRERKDSDTTGREFDAGSVSLSLVLQM